MYKDKPYSYVSSRKWRPWYRRRRFLGVAILGVLGSMYWLGLLPLGTKVDDLKASGSSSWAWLSKPPGANVDWNDRRERVKEVFIQSWDGYEKYAWGMFDVRSVSCNSGIFEDEIYIVANCSERIH